MLVHIAMTMASSLGKWRQMVLDWAGAILNGYRRLVPIIYGSVLWKARFDRARRAGWGSSARRGIINAVQTRYQGGWGFLCLLFIGVLGVSIDPGRHILGRLSDSSTSATYISILWPVVGSVLSLTIAVLIFALQAQSTTRFGGSLRELAEDSWLLPYLFLGTVSLLLDGAVFLGFGTGAPGGWASSWAIVVSALVLFLLPFLVLRVMDSLYSPHVHQRRLRQLYREVERAVDRNVLELIALGLLQDGCTGSGIQLSLLAVPPANHSVVTARKSGTVTDISLDYVAAIGRRIPAVQAGASPILYVKVGDRVRAGTPIISVPPGMPLSARLVAELLLRIGSGNAEE